MRFEQRRSGVLQRFVGLFVFAAAMACFLYLLTSFGKTTIERQQEGLENAIHRGIVGCYALEGIYPPSLSYLKEHYGLVWDEDTFFVDYEPIAANLYPDVTVMKKKGR